MKKICALTMARNDEFFLSKWIQYYGSQFGEENLYVLLDGKDQPIPENAGKAHVIRYEHIADPVIVADKKRIIRLSNIAKKLFEKYDLVVGTDADEFLVVDPLTGKSLAEYLSQIMIAPSVSGLGLDVGQKLEEEKEIDPALPFLVQRNYALVSSRYTKSVVISKPVTWGAGFHRVKKHNFKIDPNLYLFHFGSVDYNRSKQRFLDKDRMSAGWERHLKKRLRTISLVAEKQALNADRWLPRARMIQTFIRPLYAWNKPSMAHLEWVVKIPDRFKLIV